MKHTKVLAWVNRIRKQYQGKRPLLKLPKGELRSSTSCVIHNCFAKSGDLSIWVKDGFVAPAAAICGLAEEPILFPKYVEKFIERFDVGLYPELIQK